MPQVVRALSPSEFSEWKPLWEGYLKFYGHPVTDKQTEDLWSRFFIEGPELFCRVAENDVGAVIGIVHYLFHATTWTERPKCYLQDLFVDPSARVRGAGRALIEDVYAEAKTSGASEVYWTTQEFNSVARVLYDRIGERTPFIKYRKLLTA